jgi:predicted metal-dependent phosphoesterase TrpH
VGFRVDAHLHTRRHSRCSRLDEHQLIAQAVRRGLQGVVITEHHYQWGADELEDLRRQSGETAFTLLAGFEYTSSQGDLLIYGLEPGDVGDFRPGGDPEAMLRLAQSRGAVCFAAHPTRAGLAFDERIAGMPLDGLEVRSVNLKPHEQRLAARLAQQLDIPPTASSDAHRIEDVGRHALQFDAPIHSMADFVGAVRAAKFRPADDLDSTQGV